METGGRQTDSEGRPAAIHWPTASELRNAINAQLQFVLEHCSPATAVLLDYELGAGASGIDAMHAIRASGWSSACAFVTGAAHQLRNELAHEAEQPQLAHLQPGFAAAAVGGEIRGEPQIHRVVGQRRLEPQEALLGMSFLSRTQMKRDGDSLTLVRRY